MCEKGRVQQRLAGHEVQGDTNAKILGCLDQRPCRHTASWRRRRSGSDRLTCHAVDATYRRDKHYQLTAASRSLLLVRLARTMRHFGTASDDLAASRELTGSGARPAPAAVQMYIVTAVKTLMVFRLAFVDKVERQLFSPVFWGENRFRCFASTIDDNNSHHRAANSGG